MDNCIFCKIINKQIPSKPAYEDDLVYAFHDINPVAPVHILIVPKAHIPSAAEISAQNSGVTAHIFEVAAKLAQEQGIDKSGFRIVTNCGENAGQTVFHLHYHLLGGRDFTWPPG